VIKKKAGEKMSIIEELRRKNDMSQTELGERIGVKQNTISLWERGSHMPPTNKLLLLSRIFNVTTDYLLGIESSNPA
jgi:transcriptional regulator with XRE-family HTH domain